MFFYFPSKNNVGELVYTLLQYKIYSVKGLQANVLIDNYIISLEAIVINVGKKNALIKACGMTIKVNTKERGRFFTKKLFTSQESIISPCSKLMVSFVKVLLSDDQNFPL